jgi:hypothetical protein
MEFWDFYAREYYVWDYYAWEKFVAPLEVCF